MKYLILLALILSSNVFAVDYSSRIIERKDMMTAAQRAKYDEIANKPEKMNKSTSSSSGGRFDFNIGRESFSIINSRIDELIMIRRLDKDTSRWNWISVLDTYDLERACNSQGGDENCSEILPFLEAFLQNGTEILQRDFGGVVVIPKSWIEKLEQMISNNIEFDESNIILTVRP